MRARDSDDHEAQRIAFVTADSRIYHPRHFHLMATALSRAGLPVVVVGRRSEGAPAEKSPIATVSLPPARGRMMRMLGAPSVLLRAARLRPALIQINSLELLPWAVMLRLVTRIPMVYDSNEDYASAMLLREWLPAPVRRAVSRIVGSAEPWLASRLDATLTADIPSAEKFRRSTRPVLVVHNFPWRSFVDGARPATGKPQYDVTYHGSLHGYYEDLIVGTAQRLEAGGIAVSWCIAAREFTPDDQRRLEERLIAGGVRERFTLLYNLPFSEMPRLVAETRIGFIPCPDAEKYRRNLPRKLFEFMAAGRPAVVSDLPNIRAVGDGACVYARAGDPEAYAAALRSLLMEPTRAEQIGSRGRALIRGSLNAESETTLYTALCAGLARRAVWPRARGTTEFRYHQGAVAPEPLTPETRAELRPEMRERSAADWLSQFRDGLPALIVCILIGVGLAAAYTAVQKDQYEADDSILVSSARGFLDPNYAENLQALTTTVGRLAGTQTVLYGAQQRFLLSSPNATILARRRAVASTSWISRHFSATPFADSSILNIQATTDNASDAIDLARAASLTISEMVNRNEAQSQGLSAIPPIGFGVHKLLSAGLTVGAYPVHYQGKVSPTIARNFLVGGDVGLLVGIVAALLLGARRRRLRRASDVSEAVGVLSVAEVRERGGSIAELGNVDCILRSIESRRGESGEPLLALVTGPARARDIGRVAEAIAVSASAVATAEPAADGRGAVLVDADFRSCSSSLSLGLGEAPGLSELLLDDSSALQGSDASLRHVAARAARGDVWVLPAGQRQDEVDLLVLKRQIRQVLGETHRAAVLMVLAGPSLSDDAAAGYALAEAADCVVLVVRRGLLARRLRRLVDSSVLLRRRVAGVILLR